MIACILFVDEASKTGEIRDLDSAHLNLPSYREYWQNLQHIDG
jgi:hypothetical protein